MTTGQAMMHWLVLCPGWGLVVGGTYFVVVAPVGQWRQKRQYRARLARLVAHDQRRAA